MAEPPVATPVISSASLDDLDAVLPLHERAFAGSMGVAFGRPYLRPFLASFLDGAGRVFLVARLEDRPVGYVFGRPADDSDDRVLMWGVARGLLRHPGILRRKDIRAELTRRLRRFDEPDEETPGLPGPTIDLFGIGTDPSAQGRGVGRALMAAFEADVVRLGFASARLSVYRDNLTARGLYERCGWTPEDHPKPALLSYVWVPPA
jgi:ribosomal protein S18 acetylase RimI-like enzyme